MRLPTISAVCCTYRRFSCVERVINCFLQQNYPHKELIVFNTDMENPYIDNGCEWLPRGVLFINWGKDHRTKKPYDNVGAIRRDALKFASGDYVITYDDDDIYLPWFMEQAVERMKETGLPSFKPQKSFYKSREKLELVSNTMEASVVANKDLIEKYGYRLETGTEGLGWYEKMRDNRELDENDLYYLPSYCFNWGDGEEMKAPHKQSGDINNPENFNNHKKYSTDAVNGHNVRIYNNDEMQTIYQPYYDYIKQNGEKFPPVLLEKYASFLKPTI